MGRKEVLSGLSTVVKAVNNQLTAQGVPACHLRKKPGNNLRGEWELLGIEGGGVRQILDGLLWMINYRVKDPDGKVRTFAVRHSNGAIAIVLINDEDILLTKVHRFALGVWDKGFPESFTHAKEAGKDQLNELFGNEKLNWLVESADSIEWEHLGSYYPDSGTSSQQTQIYLVKVRIGGRVYEKAMPRLKRIKFQRKTPDEVSRMIADGKLKSGSLLDAWCHFLVKRLA
jgi:hypothetical protein